MRCSLHCPPPSSLIARAAAVLIAVVAVRLAWLVASSVIGAVILLEALTVVVLLVVLVRVLRYGALRKPQVKTRVIVVPQIRGRNQNRTALPAPPKAITAARAVPGEALGAAEGERVEA